MRNFSVQFFHVFIGKKYFFEYCSVSLKSSIQWRWNKLIMNFKETFSIVSCSTRNTSPRDLCIPKNTFARAFSWLISDGIGGVSGIFSSYFTYVCSLGQLVSQFEFWLVSEFVCLFGWFGHLKRRISDCPIWDVASCPWHSWPCYYQVVHNNNNTKSVLGNMTARFLRQSWWLSQPSKYCRGSKLLNFSDQKGNGS